MIAIVMAISKLTSKLQYQNHIAWLRERRTNALYRMTKALSEALSIQHIIVIAAEHLTTLFQAKIAILLTEQPQKIGLPNPPQKSDLWIQSPNLGIAQWVYDNKIYYADVINGKINSETTRKIEI
jgi:two-component system sensor histidine kinase KdpD